MSATPIIKRVGGKRQLLPAILPLLPEPKSIRRYFEPFVGGAAVFFALRAAGFRGRSVLADADLFLMRTYAGVQNDTTTTIARLREYAEKHSEKRYYEVRSKMPTLEWTDGEAAAWYIYLNKTCFNGVWRVNQSGQFNVPIGRYDNPTICDRDALFDAAEALGDATLLTRSFEHTISSVEKGDVVYFDPPYPPKSATSNFRTYTANGFNFDKHVILRDTALTLKKRGAHVLVSNADLPPVRELYAKGFEIIEVRARRNINSKGAGRGTVGEILIL